MQIRIYILILFLCCIACNSERLDNSDSKNNETATEITFDETNWRIKEGSDYPYRAQMLNDLIYDDSVRALNADVLLELLGEPDRINEGHLYYMITQKRLWFWPLHTKTLVIKLTEDSTIEWMKIHE